ncbi:hypothetical protein ACQPZX_09015 [Actinoplanes sp. CA-142083]|uniref:hypothetical protein n=1 Tax=Actinoplanes sp. CA-142083 TaxID=3239903 RepID=UPI003D8C944F
MVRSHRRRLGAALLATVLCGMLTVVDARTATAVIPSADLSDLAIYIMSAPSDVMRIGPDGTVSFPGRNVGNLAQGMAAAPDGTLYAITPLDNKVWEIAPGEAPAVVPFSTTVTAPQDVAVDDAGTLYAASTGTNRIVKRAPDGTETSIPFSAGILAAMAVDHDGSHIYLFDLANSGEIVRMDADGGNRTVIAGWNDIQRIVAFTVDDQKRIYVGNSDGDLYRITPGSGSNTIDHLATNVGNITRLAVSDNGEVFVVRYNSTDMVRVHPDGTIEPIVSQLPAPAGLLVRTVPAPPTTVTATAGSGSADVEWNAGQTNGGRPIARYTAVSDPGGLTCTPAVPTDTHCTVTGLTAGVP